MSDSGRQHFLNLTVSPQKPFYSDNWYNAVSECIKHSYSTYIIAEEKGKDTKASHIHVAIQTEAVSMEVAHNTLNQRVYRAVKSLPGYHKNHTIKIVDHENAYPFGYDCKESLKKEICCSEELLDEGTRIFTVQGTDLKLKKAERNMRNRMFNLAERLNRFKKTPVFDRPIGAIDLSDMKPKRLFERMCAEGFEETTFGDYHFFQRNSGLIIAFLEDIANEEWLKKREAEKTTRETFFSEPSESDATLGNVAAKKPKTQNPPQNHHKGRCLDCHVETVRRASGEMLCMTCAVRRSRRM